MYKTSARRRHHNFDLYDDVEKIKSALATAAIDVKDRAGDMFREKTSALQDNVSNYASDKPFKTIGIALLSGLILGFLIRK